MTVQTDITVTIDHYIVDGAPGTAFLQTLVQRPLHPTLIFAAEHVLSGVEGEA
jgi:pyruvate/2-oxoglutarate dehydrogenase complex dihydrolipoamide acyltransferase (E2) component